MNIGLNLKKYLKNLYPIIKLGIILLTKNNIWIFNSLMQTFPKSGVADFLTPPPPRYTSHTVTALNEPFGSAVYSEYTAIGAEHWNLCEAARHQRTN